MPDIFLSGFRFLARPWTELRGISNSYSAKSTILIPIIGYLIIFNDKVVSYLALSKELGGSSTSGISTRLLLVYFGLCLIAVGTSLYGFYCPPEVKHYGSANAYIAGDGESMKAAVLKAVANRLGRHDFDERFEHLLREHGEMRYQNPPSNPELNNAMLHMYFDYMNTRHRNARIVSTVSYIVGFICLGIPSLQVFLRVLMLMVQKVLAH